MQNNVDQSSCLDSGARQKAGDELAFARLAGLWSLVPRDGWLYGDIGSMAIEIGTRRFMGVVERVGIGSFPSWLFCIGNSVFHWSIYMVDAYA